MSEASLNRCIAKAVRAITVVAKEGGWVAFPRTSSDRAAMQLVIKQGLLQHGQLGGARLGHEPATVRWLMEQRARVATLLCRRIMSGGIVVQDGNIPVGSAVERYIGVQNSSFGCLERYGVLHYGPRKAGTTVAACAAPRNLCLRAGDSGSMNNRLLAWFLARRRERPTRPSRELFAMRREVLQRPFRMAKRTVRLLCSELAEHLEPQTAGGLSVEDQVL
ncbi:hypothetical protein HPB49_011733 [Dermacentor silvarum]|uniref:Uncharacterized protein n=1 Tax=Dermacentor silvarum TaxID=543639 RepID=A0ACB8CR86_DERSI|nr:hypothetical protein HPB49_011733 [Dermacentor silvarum]